MAFVLSYAPTEHGVDTLRLRSFQSLIREGEWQKVMEFGADSSLWWQPNASGWTSVHYASSGPFIQMKLWRWILQQQQPLQPNESSASRLFDERNNLGQSVWDVFLATAVDPFPWQSSAVKGSARFLQEAMESVLNSPHRETWLQGIRRVLADYFLNPEVNLIENIGRIVDAINLPRQSASVVSGRCLQFLIRLRLLCDASGYGDQIMTALARSGGKLPTRTLAAFLWALFPCCEALHVWAATPQVTPCSWTENEEEHWLLVALRLWPDLMERQHECTGRTILEAAVAAGKPWPVLQCLMERSTTAISPDPVSNLPLVALRATTTHIDTHTALIHACQQVAGPQGLMTGWTSRHTRRQKADIRSAHETLEAQELSVVYLLLRMEPQVLPECRKDTTPATKLIL